MSTENEWESTKGDGAIWNPTKDEEGNAKQEAEAEDILDGYYIAIKHDVGPNDATLHTLETAEGEKISVWGTKALNDELAKVRFGQFIRIQWLGKKLTKAGAAKKPNQRGTKDSFHAWEVFISKKVKPMDANNTAQNASTGKPETKAPMNQGAPKKQEVTKEEEDDCLPF